MQQLVNDLKSIPGVIGACCFDSKNGLMANSLPSLFKQDRLNNIGKLLAKIVSAGRLNFPDLADLLLSYEETTILCRPLGGNLYLVILCDPGVNMNLLTMSLNLALEDLAVQGDGGSVQAATPQAGGQMQTSSESLMENSSLAKPLKTMRELLAKIIGPMAGIVFDDTLAQWCASAPPGKNGLPRLLDMLNKEIGDDEKAAKYRDLVRDALSGE